MAVAAPPPPGSTLQVALDSPRACLVAGEHPQLQGSILPMGGARQVRLFFRSSLNTDYYYVEAVLAGGRSMARLPCPRPEAGFITFYFDATGDGGQGRSVDADAIVVRKSEDCASDRASVPVSPGGPVRVFDAAGNPAFPAGFGGVAGAATACEVSVRPVAGAGSRNFFGTTAGLVTLAAAGLGIAAIIIVSNDNQPTSPSR